MSLVSYDVFLPHLIPMVPNAPHPSAVIAVRNACIDFCTGSLVLQQPLEPISTAAGVPDYEVDVDLGVRLVQVVSLFNEGSPVVRRSQSEIAAKYGRDWQVMSGSPAVFTQVNPKEVLLVPIPDQSVTDALTGMIAVAPTRASTTVDDRLFELYLEQIARGAASKLLKLPDEPFSNMTAGMVYARQFTADIANARAGVLAGQNRAPMRVRFNRT